MSRKPSKIDAVCPLYPGELRKIAVEYVGSLSIYQIHMITYSVPGIGLNMRYNHEQDVVTDLKEFMLC